VRLRDDRLSEVGKRGSRDDLHVCVCVSLSPHGMDLPYFHFLDSRIRVVDVEWIGSSSCLLSFVLFFCFDISPCSLETNKPDPA
jgi:hypothetical protein